MGKKLAQSQGHGDNCSAEPRTTEQLARAVAALSLLSNECDFHIFGGVFVKLSPA